MRISQKLNIVIPLDTDGGTIYVHSAPVSREVFERYYLVLGRTFSAIYRQGLEIMSGPRVAMLLLKDQARQMGVEEDVQRGLVNEIRRLTNVVVQTPDRGWETLPLDTAISRQMIDADDASEVDNALAFFTVVSTMHRREDQQTILDGVRSLWGAETTSLNSTEYADFLRTSTADATSATTTSSPPS